MITVQRCA